MADDTIVRPHFGGKPRETATCTHIVPGCRSDNLRDLMPGDLTPEDAMHALGIGLGLGIPHTEGSTRVGKKTLRELYQRLDSILVAATETEQAMMQAVSCLERAARMNVLVRGEIDTIARRIAELGGEGPDTPKGAA